MILQLLRGRFFRFFAQDTHGTIRCAKFFVIGAEMMDYSPINRENSYPDNISALRGRLPWAIFTKFV